MIFNYQRGEFNHPRGRLFYLMPALLFLFLTGFLVYRFFFVRDNIPLENTQNTKREFKREVEKFGADTLPEGFPQDLPAEDGAVVTANEISNITTRKGESERHIIKSYLSQKTVSENFKIYKDYIISKNWQILTELNPSDNSAFIVARDVALPNQTLIFEFNKNIITGDSSVRITVVKK